MEAIVTRYLGATNYRPARIVATGYDRRIVRSYNHELNARDNHDAAAVDLAQRLGANPERLVRGDSPRDGFTYVLDVPSARVVSARPDHATAKENLKGWAAEQAAQRSEVR